MLKEFVIPLVLVLTLLWVYLYLIRPMPGLALAGLMLVTFAGGALLYKADELTKLSVDPKGGVIAEMEAIKKDVYAKAESVRRMGEDVAGAIAYAITRLGKFAPKDLVYQIGQQHEHLSATLQRIGTDKLRAAEVLQPLTRAIQNDLAMKVVIAADEELRTRTEVTTKEQADALKQKQTALKSLGRPLLDSDIGGAIEVARAFLQPKNLWTPAVQQAVERFENFRLAGHVTPNPDDKE